MSARSLAFTIVLAAGCTPASVPTTAIAAPTAPPAPPAPIVAVGPQYDTTHVYVNAQDVDRFATSFLATFGGHSTKQSIVTVTPTPSSTSSQLLQTPVGTVSLFGFRTGIPYPFAAERNGYLVTDIDTAIQAARAAGADVIVTPFNDPIGRDAVVQWPGGVNMQLYWHTKTPSYEPFQLVPENRVYVSADRADAFVHSFLAFSHGNVVSDEPHAPGVEIGRPSDRFRRIRIESTFGKMTVLVTDGHVPYPFGHETTGYEVADLGETLAKAKQSGANVVVDGFHSGDRDAAMVEFPGGYIAEIHARSSGESLPAMTAAPTSQATPISHDDLKRWASAWNSHDIDSVLALFAPDVVIHQPANPKPLDAHAARAFFAMIFKAYPDFHVELENAVVEGMTGVSIERVTGTWRGPYTDPSSKKTTTGNGRAFDHPGVMVLAYTPEHKIKQVDIYWDRLVVNQQLGIANQRSFVRGFERMIRSAAILLLVAIGTARAQDAPSQDTTSTRPTIQMNRWEEDWSVLADPALRTEPLDSLKYISLGDDPHAYLSLGLTLRERFELYDAINFAVGNTPGNGYLLQRFQVHANVHLDRHLYAFVELEDVRAFGKDTITPVDENPLDVRLAYVEYDTPIANTVFKARAGRQGFAFDLQRFVSLRDGPNVRQSFDAAWADWETHDWRVIGFVSAPVQYQHAGIFDSAG